MNEAFVLFGGLLFVELFILFISILVTCVRMAKWDDRTRPMPDWFIEENSIKYGRPVFLILNIIFWVVFFMETYHAQGY